MYLQPLESPVLETDTDEHDAHKQTTRRRARGGRWSWAARGEKSTWLTWVVKWPPPSCLLSMDGYSACDCEQPDTMEPNGGRRSCGCCRCCSRVTFVCLCVWLNLATSLWSQPDSPVVAPTFLGIMLPLVFIVTLFLRWDSIVLFYFYSPTEIWPLSL